MSLSQTTHYALRAVYFLLINQETKWHLAKDIAKATKIPAPYLARILSVLAKRRILQSRTGMGGGFSINDETLNASLYDVVSQFENLDDIRDCIFGFSICCEGGKCNLHDSWHKIKNQMINLFKTTTLADLKNMRKEFDWTKTQA